MVYIITLGNMSGACFLEKGHRWPIHNDIFDKQSQHLLRVSEVIITVSRERCYLCFLLGTGALPNNGLERSQTLLINGTGRVTRHAMALTTTAAE